MRSVWTIFRGELWAYVNSPVGYIFAVVFLGISSGLYILESSGRAEASMDGFFFFLPIGLSIFCAVLTMRIWAEERKIGTIELLMTLPMRSWHLVAGKFAAAWCFTVLVLAGSAGIPIALAVLGDPDPGPILGGYLSAAFLAAQFVAMGMCISALFREQIISFLIAWLIGLGLWLIGLEFTAGLADSWLPGAGTFVREHIAFTRHFDSVGQGLLDLRDLIYFGSWTLAFLAINVYTLDSLIKVHARAALAVSSVLLFWIAAFANLLIDDLSGVRYDLTEGDLYTLSPESEKILSRLKVPVRIRYYVTSEDKMPSAMKTLERDVTHKLREFRHASDNFVFEVIDPELTGLEEALKQKNISKVVVRQIEKERAESTAVWSAMTITYLDRKEEVLPSVEPDSLPSLEYELISRILRMTQNPDDRPTVAIFAGESMPSEQEIMAAVRSGRSFPPGRSLYGAVEQILRSNPSLSIVTTRVTAADPIPEDADLLLVLGPRDLTDRQRFELNRALRGGLPMIVAVQTATMDAEVNDRSQLQFQPGEVKPGINEWLGDLGAPVDTGILLDPNAYPLSYRIRMGGFGVQVESAAPLHIQVTSDQFDRGSPLTASQPYLLYLWGSRVKLDPAKLTAHGLKSTTLARSSDGSWVIPFRVTPLTSIDLKTATGDAIGTHPLAVMLEGTFPDTYAGKEIPDWPEHEHDHGDAAPVETMPEPKATRLLVIGSGIMFEDDVVTQLQPASVNVTFMINAVEAMSMGEDLIRIRSKQRADRPLKKLTPMQMLGVRAAMLLAVPLLLAIAGGVRAIVRARGREKYRRSL